ncbi:MAG: hypothetical protein CMH49_06625 [Myxococcales bacterium]|nr:hypothetical protein [Myxococcales bacterium]
MIDNFSYRSMLSHIPKDFGKTVLCIFVLLTFGCTTNPCQEKAVLYGKLNQEVVCYLPKKVKHGPHTKWYPKSEFKQFERNYNNDILDGLYKEWYSNGQLKVQATYSNGQLEGSFNKYYSNGNKRVEGRYAENVRVSVYKEYYKNGKLKLSYNYSPIGKFEGKQVRYRMNGFPLSEYTYYEGKLIGKRFWRNNGTQEPVLSHR